MTSPVTAVKRQRDISAPSASLPLADRALGPEPALGEQWRSLTRTATLVALLTAPVAFVWFHSHNGLALRYALLLTLVMRRRLSFWRFCWRWAWRLHV
jgi:hypothetical protein